MVSRRLSVVRKLARGRLDWGGRHCACDVATNNNTNSQFYSSSHFTHTPTHHHSTMPPKRKAPAATAAAKKKAAAALVDPETEDELVSEGAIPHSPLGKALTICSATTEEARPPFQDCRHHSGIAEEACCKEACCRQKGSCRRQKVQKGCFPRRGAGYSRGRVPGPAQDCTYKESRADSNSRRDCRDSSSARTLRV